MNTFFLKHARRAMMGLLVLWLGGWVAQAQTLEKSLLWEVSGNGLKSPSYLFGTYHLLNHSWFEEQPAALHAFRKSEGVVVEMLMDSSLLPRIAYMGIMPDRKISELLSKEDFDQVDKALQKGMGFSLRMLDQMKPAVVQMMLTMGYAQQEVGELLAKYPGQPQDLWFASQGQKEGKQVTAFETMEQQIKILYDGLSVEDQARQLVEMVRDRQDDPALNRKLAELYMTQDLPGMWAFYVEQSAKSDISMAHLIDDRNQAWAEALPDLMAEGSQFVGVGALHLPGPTGLITLLRNQGYTVAPVRVEAPAQPKKTKKSRGKN
jgi:uncharacterized protein